MRVRNRRVQVFGIISRYWYTFIVRNVSLIICMTKRPPEIPPPVARQENNDKWHREREKIAEYIEKNNINSRELEAAYQLALGVPENDEDIAPLLTNEVKSVTKLLEKHISDGFPLNEIAEMITDRTRLESTKDSFHKWVSGLSLSQNEKKLLHSIVEERRVGTIQFVDKKTGNDIFEFKIPKTEVSHSSTPVWAFNFERLLKDALARSTGKGIAIWFEAS